MKAVILWTGVVMLALASLVGAQVPLADQATPVSDVSGDVSGNFQSNPDVAADSEGRFLVVWDSFPVQISSYPTVYGRWFNSNGTVRTDEVLLSEDGFPTRAQQPRASWTGEGNSAGQRFVVVWESSYYGSAFQVEGAVLDVAGPSGEPPVSAVDFVDLFVASDPEAGMALAPAVAGDFTTGRFAVVWKEVVGDGTYSVRGGWFDRGGVLLSAFEVDTCDCGLGGPEVALLPNGNVFAVTYPGDLGLDGSAVLRTKLFRVDGDGTVSEMASLQVNVNDRGFLPGSAPIVYSASGEVLVLWQRCRTGSLDPLAFTGCGIFGRAAHPAMGIGPEFQVNSAVEFDETSPHLAVDSAGDFITVWQNDPLAGGNSSFSIQRLRPLAVPRLGPLFLDGQFVTVPVGNPPGTDPRRSLTQPRTAALSDQRFVVAWTEVFADDASPDQVAFLRYEPTVKTRCVPDRATLCLAGDRFRVRAGWTAPDGRTGTGRPAQMTADTGYFSFVNRSSIELLVKVVATRCGVDACFQVFAGGMTYFGVELEVTDTVNGTTVTYSNPLGRLFEPIRDRGSFRGAAATATAAPPERRVFPPNKAARGCGGGPDALCLHHERFRVELEWNSPHGQGVGRGLALSGEAGYFYFSRPADVETFVKLVDGCTVNRHYWLFAAGLTDAGVTMRVTDTATGEEKSYANPQGTAYQPIADISAFRCAASR